ncbi:MAG: 4-hydroxy-tetrahydrodipicolinate synthase [Clostridiales bacterium]|nr:4-hydroxy-tetrahydrodipicolinate synthase [Clostridiales bacterium]MCD7827927.1 4-hydroxy-tetrahydrodipicolinate synthase [Clostridiales bacterium]
MKKKVIFEGSAIAIITPFTEDLKKIDYDKFEKIINYQIENGTDAIVVCGTTGEGSTLSHEEHVNAMKFCVDVADKRVPVIAGTGSNDTFYAVELSNEAEKAGVDGLLMVTPYYNKTSQSGLIEHYNYIADRVSAPIILYHVPSRTGMTIKPETYYELAKHERIVATKEACGNISEIEKTASLCGDSLTIYSGNDDQILPIMALGGKGVISVLSHVVPTVAHNIVKMYLDGDVKGSRDLQLEYLDLCNALFCDVNPIPVKEAMNMMGWNVGRCRMPLGHMNEQQKAGLLAVLKKHNLA